MSDIVDPRTEPHTFVSIAFKNGMNILMPVTAESMVMLYECLRSAVDFVSLENPNNGTVFWLNTHEVAHLVTMGQTEAKSQLERMEEMNTQAKLAAARGAGFPGGMPPGLRRG
jgi:hypothetical protein